MDTFDFENDNSTWTKWYLGYEKKKTPVYFVNAGDTSISPVIICSEDITLKDANGTIYYLKKGENKDFALTLDIGINYFEAQGNGTVAMHYSNEVMA